MTVAVKKDSRIGKISTSGQITLPRSLWDHLDVEPGDSVLFTPQDRGGILMTKSNARFVTPKLQKKLKSQIILKDGNLFLIQKERAKK